MNQKIELMLRQSNEMPGAPASQISQEDLNQILDQTYPFKKGARRTTLGLSFSHD